jgi:hypothetical protein
MKQDTKLNAAKKDTANFILLSCEMSMPRPQMAQEAMRLLVPFFSNPFSPTTLHNVSRRYTWEYHKGREESKTTKKQKRSYHSFFTLNSNWTAKTKCEQ